MPNYLNKESLEKLKKELDYLRNTERKNVAKQLEHAIGFGDLSENAAYHDAREAKESLERRISELSQKIEQAVIIKVSKNTNLIQIGSTVFVESGKDKLCFEIVDSEEVDTLNGKISYDSPLGKTLLNKSKGEIAKVNTPSGNIEYKIIKIE
jgi:transcription elongation factor GreA